ncbi:cyclin-dependent kinase 2-interacting protein-like, partial [Anneissia japonica]|uniref:cyclin-dependent kinase 2-interacting protein-like n=1 Tax=Anneissia japonica TaxID=1529436 RepID=UPI0014259D80
RRSSKSSVQAQNLQGSARVIRDHCADWHNYLLKWDELNDAGVTVAKKIVNCKLQADYQSEASEPVAVHLPGGANNSTAVTRQHDGMPDGLQELCYDLQMAFDGQEKLVQKMVKVTKHLKATIGLQDSLDKSSMQILFQTWPTKYFYETSQELLSMYSKELSVKKAVLENIAHSKSRDALMMYVSTWQIQPYIGDRAKLLLE